MAGDAKIGDRVVVEGLKQSGMNGLEGTLLEIDATGRLVVSLDDMLGKHYSFKRENVHKATIHITNMPDKETTAEESDPNKTRRIYAVLILLCVVGFLYHKNTVSSRHERELRRLQEVHARTFDQAINDHIQNVDAKQLLAPTPQPTTFDDSLKNVFAKIATRFRSQLFKDGEYMCVRMSPGLLLSDAIAAHNVTWISFGQDAPQSEFMVRCYQSMVKMVDKTAASVNRQVYVVRDGDDTATLGTKEETMFLEDAMRWVVSRMSPATSICGDQHRLLESLQTADGILMQNTPNGCNFIERLICSQASLVMQFGGPRDTIATAGKGIYYPTCGDFSTRRRTAQDRDKDKDKDKEGTPDTTQEPMSEGNMKRLSKLYPVAAEKACSIGNVKIPFRSEGGRSLMMCGMGAFKDVKSLMRLEGQALFPMGVTEKEWQGDAEVGDDLLFGDLTPIVVTVSKWEDSTVGPYSEVQFCNIATYHRMNVPFKRHPYLSPYVLENIPASRLYPMLTITDSPKYAAISTELYHLPTVCRPELNIIEDEKGVKGFSGVEGNTHIPEIVGVDIGVEVGDSSEGLREWGEKWMHVSQTIGLDRLFVNCLEGRRHLKYTIPHGRSTVTGRAINDYKGTRNPLGVVSGVDLKEHAAKCGADYHLVYHNAKNQYTRKWCSTDKATLPSFQPDVIVQTSGLSSIRQLPQPTVLPFHTSDQKRGELNRLSLECSEALASRQPSIEQPDEFREPTPLIDLQKRDRKMQGAQWKG